MFRRIENPEGFETPVPVRGQTLVGTILLVLKSHALEIVNNREKWALGFFNWYCFVLALGFLARFSPYGLSGFGLTTILMVLVIVVRLPELLRVMTEQRLLWLWLLLIGYIGTITFFDLQTILFKQWTYRELAVISGYVLFASAVATLNWTPAKIFSVAKYLMAGFFLCAMLIVVDEIGLVDVPRINDYPQGDFGLLPGYYYHFGQYGHRTTLALYVATSLAFLLVMVESELADVWFRGGVLIVSAVYWYLLLLTQNRSGPAALFVALGLYFVFHVKVQRRMCAKRIPDFILPIALASVAFALVVPYAFHYYFYLWASSPLIASLFPNLSHLWTDETAGTIGNVVFGSKCFLPCVEEQYGAAVYRGDSIRLTLLRNALSAMQRNPFGSGFFYDIHISFLTDVIYAAGIVGILWLLVYGVLFIPMVRKAARVGQFEIYAWALLTGIFAWLLMGIMYNASNLGLGWGFLGMMISFSKFVEAKNLPIAEKNRLMSPSLLSELWIYLLPLYFLITLCISFANVQGIATSYIPFLVFEVLVRSGLLVFSLALLDPFLDKERQFAVLSPWFFGAIMAYALIKMVLQNYFPHDLTYSLTEPPWLAFMLGGALYIYCLKSARIKDVFIN
jgi:hypothetical protein